MIHYMNGTLFNCRHMMTLLKLPGTGSNINTNLKPIKQIIVLKTNKQKLTKFNLRGI